MGRPTPQWGWKSKRSGPAFRFDGGQRKLLATLVPRKLISLLERAVLVAESRPRPPRPSEILAALDYGLANLARLLSFVRNADEISRQSVALELAPESCFEAGFDAAIVGPVELEAQLARLQEKMIRVRDRIGGRQMSRLTASGDGRLAFYVLRALEDAQVEVTKNRAGRAVRVLNICLTAVGRKREVPYELLRKYIDARRGSRGGQ